MKIGSKLNIHIYIYIGNEKIPYFSRKYLLPDDNSPNHSEHFLE